MLKKVLIAAMVSTLVSTPALASDYRLRFGDAINVTVVDHPELSVASQPIRPDGRISLPLVPEYSASGKSINETTQDLANAYKHYLANPQLSVSIAHFRPLRVTILGQVQHPGTYDFEDVPSVVGAIATAGGLTERAERSAIKVIAPQASQTYNLNSLLKEPASIPVLADGAIIEVGEVWGPDYYRLIPTVATVITAVALLIRR